VGVTHPVVKQKEGETYRRFLERKVKEKRLESNVLFINKYLTLSELLSYIQASDVCISCNLGLEQSVSGTLSYALGSGRVVIATNFRQAKSIVTEKVGKLVPPGDSEAIREALLYLLSNEERLKEMNWNSYKLTRSMIWPNVADEYLRLIREFVKNGISFLPPINVKHLERMLNKLGIVQFANLSTPDLGSGYTIDDNARALICYLKLYEFGYVTSEELRTKLELFLETIERTRQVDNRFINYLAGNNPSLTSKNELEDLDDTLGRVLWAMCEIQNSRFFESTSKVFKRSEEIIRGIIPHLESLEHLRAIGFALYGLSLLEKDEFYQEAEKLAAKIKKSYIENSSKDWKWFEPELTYANGILPASLLIYSGRYGDKESLHIALESLDFLCSLTFFGEVFVPIGNKGWYKKGKERAFFDQQPEETFHMILALFQAWKKTKDTGYKKLIHKCFSWFLGNNAIGESLYNSKTGGCFDGLTAHGVNKNQGAESLLSYLLSRLIVERVEK